MRGRVDIRPGMRFGRLTVTGFDRKLERKNGIPYYYWKCRCDCGTECSVMRNALISGNTTSCGCFRRERTSGRRKGLHIGEREK